MARSCTFCEVVAGRLPAHMVLEAATVVAFLDVRPLFPGHTLVLPRAHLETFEDLQPADVGAVFGAARTVAAAVRDALGAQGAFVAMNDRVSQSVPHAHVHVVPRTKGDGLRGFFWPRQRYASDEEAARTAARLAAAIAGAAASLGDPGAA